MHNRYLPCQDAVHHSGRDVSERRSGLMKAGGEGTSRFCVIVFFKRATSQIRPQVYKQPAPPPPVNACLSLKEPFPSLFPRLPTRLKVIKTRLGFVCVDSL